MPAVRWESKAWHSKSQGEQRFQSHRFPAASRPLQRLHNIHQASTKGLVSSVQNCEKWITFHCSVLYDTARPTRSETRLELSTRILTRKSTWQKGNFRKIYPPPMSCCWPQGTDNGFLMKCSYVEQDDSPVTDVFVITAKSHKLPSLNDILGGRGGGGGLIVFPQKQKRFNCSLINPLICQITKKNTQKIK